MKILVHFLFFILCSQVFAGEAKWTRKEKELIKKLSSPEFLYLSQKKEISVRSQKSIHYVLEAFSELDQKQLALDLQKFPYHRLNAFEEREMIIREVRKFELNKLLEDK